MSASTPRLHTTLADRAVIRLAGADWRTFLQGLITQDMLGMAEGEMRYAALLTPQGRVLHDLFVMAEGDGALLDVAAATREALFGRLKLYRLRAKVELALDDRPVAALFGGDGPVAGGWRADPRLPALGWRGVDLPRPKGVADAGEDAYDRHRLDLGIGDIERDGLADRAYALEANLDLLNGVDFRKGCFVGQETTSRMKRRGGVRSRLIPIRFQGPPPPRGSEVLAGERRAGEVGSGVDGVALALLRIDRAAGAALAVHDLPVDLAPPEWLGDALQPSNSDPVV